MKLFITGCTGFIGSYVLDSALKAGLEVVATRRSTSTLPVIPLSNEPIWLERTLNSITQNDLNGCDVLVHLASAGVSPKQVSLETMLEVNISNTISLVEMSYRAGVRRFVLAGSCYEYGGSALNYVAIPPCAPLQPTNLYGASKAAGFQLVSTFARIHNLELYYGRIFSAYGEGQYKENFWPSLKYSAIHDLDFHMTKGTQIRDFVPVEDVALKLIEACHRTDIQSGEPLIENIGSGRSISLHDFAHEEWVRLGATGQIIAGAIPDRPGEIERFVPLLP